MPFYLYKDSDGNEHTHRMTKFNPPPTVTVDGIVFERDMDAEAGSYKHRNDPWVKHVSTALMVNPLDVPQHRREVEAMGLSDTIKVNNDGTFSMKKKSSHEKYIKAYGFANYG